MKVAGIAVSIGTRRPHAVVVVMEGTFTEPTVLEVFDLTTTESEAADQAHDLSWNLRNRLRGLAPERVLIRRADFPPRPSNQEGPRLRLIMEGAIAAAAKDVVPDTTLLVGRDAAARTPLAKSDLDAQAESLVGTKEMFAAAAALAALPV